MYGFTTVYAIVYGIDYAIGNVIDYVIGHIIENLAMIYVIAFDF